MHDLSWRGSKRDGILGVDPALDGVAVKFDFLLCHLQTAAGGYADLFENQIDVGNHFRHRMLHLNPRIHFDEVEFPILVQEFDRAYAEIFDRTHCFGYGLADLVARVAVERGGGPFLPDLLVAALQ